MLYPPLANYKHHNCEGYRHIPATTQLYGELPGDITGALVWIEGKTECRLAVVIAHTPTRSKLMALGPGWFAFASHKQVRFLCPSPLRSWAQHIFNKARLPVASH